MRTSPAASTPVFLNVYDLSPTNDYLYPFGLGLHHSGVEIGSSEYSFASGAGVFETSVDQTKLQLPFRERLYLGSFDGGIHRLNQVLDELRHGSDSSAFGPSDYHLLTRNCNHFASALSYKLLGKPLPGHINRLAVAGQFFSCLLPRKIVEKAPVGDTTSPVTSSFIIRTGNGNRENVGTNTVAFSGVGQSLGGTITARSNSATSDRAALLSPWSSSSSGSTTYSSAGVSEDSLVDRRERARKAAVARLDKNQHL